VEGIKCPNAGQPARRPTGLEWCWRAKIGKKRGVLKRKEEKYPEKGETMPRGGPRVGS